MILSRSDRSGLSIWLWTIDKWIFFSFFTLLLLGIIFILTSSSTLELKLNKESYYFSIKHMIFVILSFLIAVILSKLNFHKIKFLSLIGFGLLLAALLYCLQYGSDIKGAKRWIDVFGQSLQPSEFIKPFFIIINAWLLTIWKSTKRRKFLIISVFSIVLIDIMLLMQPDLGMTILITTIWIFQLLIIGIPILFCIFVGRSFYEIYHYDNEGNESKLKSEYQYYTNGRLFCEDTYYYEGLEVDSIVRNKYKYDKLGNIISHRVQYQDDGRWVNIRLNLKEFDENGRLLRYLKSFFENNEMILTHEQTYKYNSLGLVIEKTSHLVTCGDQFTRSLYDRDEYGQNIKITKHYSSPHMEYTETTEYTYEYYENGLLKESNMFVIRDDEILKDNISKSYEYDKHQRLTKKFSERVQLGGNGLNFLPYISDLNFHENSERKDSLYIRNGGYGIDIVWKEDPTTVAHVNTDNLSMAHPNPFVEETTIDYELSTNDIIKIELADASGRIVYSALEGIKNAGTNQIKVNARNLVSGIYFYRIIGDHHLLTGQIVVQK